MATNLARPKWLFYPGWVIASTVGFPIAWFLAFFILAQIVRMVGDTVEVGGVRHITEDFLVLYILLPLLGLFIGLFQYLWLRRYLPKIGWWFAATALGWILAFIALEFTSATLAPMFPINSILAIAIGIVLIGGALALPQWLVLRQRIPHASWWLIATMIGWGIALIIVDGPISSTPDVLAIVFLPPIAGCVAWWLLLDKFSQYARA